MRTLHVETTTHGRVLIEDAAGAFSGRVLVCFHGYGQNADLMLDEMRRIPGASAWRLVSVQALHPFYTRGDEGVVASWMTRQDRDLAIRNNIAYVNRALDAVLTDEGSDAGARGAPRIVFFGFSQGASMAARAAVLGARRASGLVMLGGDIPPDVREAAAATWPPVLIGCGDRDKWYGARVEADIAFLASRGIPCDVLRFAGGHEFTDEFRARAGAWLGTL